MTATADQGARQTIRRIARDNPHARIVATGSKYRYLGLDNEARLLGRGVSVLLFNPGVGVVEARAGSPSASFYVSGFFVILPESLRNYANSMLSGSPLPPVE